MPHYLQLTLEQRYAISLLLHAKKTLKEVSMLSEIEYSTLTREIKRNSHKGKYDHKIAHRYATLRRKLARKPAVLTEPIKSKITVQLKRHWSPEQISGRARLSGDFDVSHQTIYNWIYADKRNHGTLYHNLRRKRTYRKHKTKGSRIRKRVMIDKRPKIVEKRGRFGDWEIDSIVSSKGDSTIILTVVERVSRYLCASMLDSRESFPLAQRLCRLLKNRHALSITSDNGTEFACHQYVAKTLKTDFYFAFPYHPWERGTNENTNGLIRQYLPSGKPLKGKHRVLSKAIITLNNRPRKCLNYRSRQELIDELMVRKE